MDYVLNGEAARAQPHVANVSFPGVDSQALMLSLRDVVAISNGSACTSASPTPSHVLKAMGIDDERIASAVRVSWGPGVNEVPSETFAEAVRALRV